MGLLNGTNGSAPAMTPLDPSRLKITPHPSPSTLPDGPLVWGASFSDHMLTVQHIPGEGWQAPEIRPFANLELHPASAVLHYAPCLFEGMKAYKPEGGEPALFRPDMNMARMNRSAARIGLPTFDHEALISLIMSLVKTDERFIPPPPYSLYIRPTMIGTRPALGVGASDHCLLYVIMSPVGPFFAEGFKPVSLLATVDDVRSWPGGTGQFKLGANYAPCFTPQKKAQVQGYQQNLWILKNELGATVTEAGQMNVFIAHKDEAGATHLITPPLNGQILPGVTRDSLLTLARAHAAGSIALAGFPSSGLVVEEREFTLDDLKAWSASGSLLECFGAGTAAVLQPISRIGIPDAKGEIVDIYIPVGEAGIGPIAESLHQRMSAIQTGTVEGPAGWKVLCH